MIKTRNLVNIVNIGKKLFCCMLFIFIRSAGLSLRNIDLVKPVSSRMYVIKKGSASFFLRVVLKLFLFNFFVSALGPGAGVSVVALCFLQHARPVVRCAIFSKLVLVLKPPTQKSTFTTKHTKIAYTLDEAHKRSSESC
jgi:hypothetical protein